MGFLIDTNLWIAIERGQQSRDGFRRMDPEKPPVVRGIVKMESLLTAAQIEAQFESEWVLVEDPQTDDALQVRSGRVVWHSRDRDEVYRKAVELRPKRFAVLYTGKMPKDTAVVL